jgi:hypothetical protein
VELDDFNHCASDFEPYRRVEMKELEDGVEVDEHEKDPTRRI